MRQKIDGLGDSDLDYGLGNMLHDMRGYIRPYRGGFIISSLLRFISDIVWLYPAWAIGEIVNALNDYNGDNRYILLLLSLWALFGIIRYSLREICKYQGFQIAERISLDARIDAIRHLFTLDLMWHEREYSGAKLKRVINGSTGLESVIREYYNYFIEASISIIGITFIFIYLDPGLSIALSLFVISFYLLSFKLTKKSMKQERIVHQGEEDIEGESFEMMNNISTIKTLELGDGLIENLTQSSEYLMEEIRKRIGYFRVREAILNIYAHLFQIACITYICFEIMAGRYNVGFLVVFIGYFSKIWGATVEISYLTNQILINMVSIGRLQTMLKLRSSIDTEGIEKMPHKWEKLTAKGLKFSYEGENVLDGIDFTINRGEKIGLVGPSGAGKTTLFKLFLKLHEDFEGSIDIDETPLKKVKRASYMKQIAVVLQDTEIFNMSLRDNISITGGDGSLDAALEIANLTELVGRLPEGVDTIIGEKGVKLSGGERQRLGIARAVYKKPKIIFLDEATSHLDSKSEEKIQKSLKGVFSKVTAVVIAHRLSTIEEMDRIVVIDEGRIIEEGGFQELIEKRGLFYELWEKQKL